MTSSTTTPARGAGNARVISIDWSLLFRRLAARFRQLFTSARHKAARTEYIPPTWFQRFHLTWFRIGLIAIAAFVFTQKQIDFTVSVGKEGLAVGATEGRHTAVSGGNGGGEQGTTVSLGQAALSLLPSLGSGNQATAVAAAKPEKTWSVDDLNRSEVEAYISRFEKVAQSEERKYSIPAAANMALAIIYSNAGQSTAATKKNNHFFPTTKNTYYENAWMNWRSHSQLVNERYPELANESVNYQQWTAALAKTDYSPDRQLASKIMDIVERYNLERL